LLAVDLNFLPTTKLKFISSRHIAFKFYKIPRSSFPCSDPGIVMLMWELKFQLVQVLFWSVVSLYMRWILQFLCVRNLGFCSSWHSIIRV